MTLFIKFLYASIYNSVPLLFGTTGEIFAQKAGNMNLGVEGMMWMGALTGFYTAYRTDSVLLAIVAAFLSGALCALIYAFLTVTLRANQNVTGLTLTTFGIGLSHVLSHAMTRSVGGAPKLSDVVIAKLDSLSIPVLSDIPYVGEVVFGQNALVYLAVVVAVIAAVYSKRTQTGLNVRAVGENPAAADAAGVNVTLLKYLHILIGGGICSVGGAYMSMVTANGSWQPGGIVNGMGWIAVALVIFAGWSHAKAIYSAFIFGAFSALENYIPASVITIPKAFYQMLPFVLTVLVLILSSVRKSKKSAQPTALGVNYFREER